MVQHELGACPPSPEGGFWRTRARLSPPYAVCKFAPQQAREFRCTSAARCPIIYLGLGESVMRKGIAAAMLGIAVTACAGRDPQPIATVQAQDAYADCPMIRAEIEANNIKIKALADEQGWKTAQNVVAGVGGLVFF